MQWRRGAKWRNGIPALTDAVIACGAASWQRFNREFS
jgi:hypothetical protein